jgi:hypothetical protein
MQDFSFVLSRFTVEKVPEFRRQNPAVPFVDPLTGEITSSSSRRSHAASCPHGLDFFPGSDSGSGVAVPDAAEPDVLRADVFRILSWI